MDGKARHSPVLSEVVRRVLLMAPRILIADGAEHVLPCKDAALLAEARPALALAREVSRAIDDGVAPLWLTEPEALFRCSRPHDHSSARGEVADMLQRAESRLGSTAPHHVPAPFQASFLERNAINRQILLLATSDHRRQCSRPNRGPAGTG